MKEDNEAPKRIFASGNTRSASSRWWSRTPTGRADEAEYIRRDVAEAEIKRLHDAMEQNKTKP